MTNSLTPGQRRRLVKIRALAERMGNMSLAPIESHLNLYRDLPRSRVENIEADIRESFMSALSEDDIPVILWLNSYARPCVSFEFATKQSSRGNVVRILAKKVWFEKNWRLLAGDLGPEASRDFVAFLKYDQATLANLVAPWWDPNVLTNPSITTSRSLLREVKERLEPGRIAFSLAMARLRSCEIYFHASDIDIVAECICTSAHKQDWWND